MPAVDELLEVRIVTHHTIGAQIGVNVRHYIVSAQTGSGAQYSEIASAIDASIHAAYKALLTNAASYRGVGVRRILPLPVTVETTSIANAGGGTVTGEPLPMQVSGIITLRTPLAGPRYRGRAYISFPGETDGDTDSRPTGGYVIRLGTLANLLKQTFQAGVAPNQTTIVPVVFSRKFGTYHQITAVSPQVKWATQRSRGNYGRPNALPF